MHLAVDKTHLGTTNGISVYLVDRTAVRDGGFSTFAEGDNWMHAPGKLGHKEIWISVKERGLLMHEACEAILMDEGYTYEEAHLCANTTEAFYRSGVPLKETLANFEQATELPAGTGALLQGVIEILPEPKTAGATPDYLAPPTAPEPQASNRDPYAQYLEGALGSPARRSAIFDIASGTRHRGPSGIIGHLQGILGERSAMGQAGISTGAPNFQQHLFDAAQNYLGRPGSVQELFGREMSPIEAMSTIGPMGLASVHQHIRNPVLWSQAFGNAARTPQERAGAQRYLHAALSLNRLRQPAFDPRAMAMMRAGVPQQAQGDLYRSSVPVETPDGTAMAPGADPAVLSPEMFPDNQSAAMLAEKTSAHLKRADDFRDSWPTAKDPGDPSDHLYHTVRKGGVVVGMAKVTPRVGGVFVSNFWVRPGWRSNGVGKGLMQRLVKHYGDGSMHLEADPFDGSPMTQEELKKFYGKHGFVAGTGARMRRPATTEPVTKTADDGYSYGVWCPKCGEPANARMRNCVGTQACANGHYFETASQQAESLRMYGKHEALALMSAPATKAAKEVPADYSAAAEDTRGYRKRVEVFATKDGKVYGGNFDNGCFGGFGGGIDEGEEIECAAKREFLEETGYEVWNVQGANEGSVKQDWKPPYSKKQTERIKEFRGSETHYVTADLGDKAQEKADGDDGASGLKNVGLWTFEEAIAACGDDDLTAGNHAQRLARRGALERLRKTLQTRKDMDAALKKALAMKPTEGKGSGSRHALVMDITRQGAEEILPLLAHIKSLGQIGACRNIVVAPEDNQFRGLYTFDGDGSSHIRAITVNGIKVAALICTKCGSIAKASGAGKAWCPKGHFWPTNSAA